MVKFMLGLLMGAIAYKLHEDYAYEVEYIDENDDLPVVDDEGWCPTCGNVESMADYKPEQHGEL